MDSGQRAIVARIHRLEHVERLWAADLADDDPVGSHTQSVAHEIANRDLSHSLDVLRPSLQAKDVCLLQLELRCVLDRDNALRVGDGLRQRVQQRGLTGTRTARDEDVELRHDAALEKVNGLL